MADALVTLQYPRDFIPQTLWSLCAGIYNASPMGDTGGALAGAWTDFFGLPPDSIEIDLQHVDHYQDSPFRWNGVLAHSYFGTLPSTVGGALSSSQRNDRNLFLSVQTMRTLFNDRLAGYLQLPYLVLCLVNKRGLW